MVGANNLDSRMAHTVICRCVDLPEVDQHEAAEHRNRASQRDASARAASQRDASAPDHVDAPARRLERRREVGKKTPVCAKAPPGVGIRGPKVVASNTHIATNRIDYATTAIARCGDADA